MKQLTLLSWNVNGLRAVHKKGALDWFFTEQPDILCIQETKSHPDQLPAELTTIDNYHSYFASASRRGYSGVALYSKIIPQSIQYELGHEQFDSEGRCLIADYNDFILFNIYFPNGKASKERLEFKMAFYDAFLVVANKLKDAGKRLIVCGDVNTAHREIDLARPKENENVSGFLPEERAWIDKFISAGYIDTFRVVNQEPGHYSWWDYKSRARERNVGWRIDYFFVSENLKDQVKSAFIRSEIQGSDHCPVGITVEF